MFDDFYDPIVVTEFDDLHVKMFRRRVLEQSFTDPKKPITIYIESYGGSVDGLASMIETIQTVPNKIHTVCTGVAMSAGAFLLSFGDERYCGQYSRIMIHEISGGTFGTTSEQINDVKEQLRMQRFWFEHLAENCGFKSVKELEREINRYDHYLSATDALEFGIVDHVGMPEFEARKKRKTRTTKKKTGRVRR